MLFINRTQIKTVFLYGVTGSVTAVGIVSVVIAGVSTVGSSTFGASIFISGAGAASGVIVAAVSTFFVYFFYQIKNYYSI